MVYTVYADVLWLVNFALDWVLLWAAGRFGGFVFRWPRSLLAAALGAFYGVGLLYPALAPLYIMPLPVFCSLLLLLVCFGRMPVRRFCWLTACFYILSFAMGGAALAVRAPLGFGEAHGMSFIWLAPALLLAGVLAALGVGVWRRQVRQSGLIVRAELSFSGKSLAIPCFLDRCNRLRDPVSGRSVLLADFAAAADWLPPALSERLACELRIHGDGFRPQQILADLAPAPWSERLRLVPYRAVGSTGRLTLGFLPDDAVFYLADGRKIIPPQTPLMTFNAAGFGGISGARAIVAPEAVFGGQDMVGYDNIWEERLEA